MLVMISCVLFMCSWCLIVFGLNVVNSGWYMVFVCYVLRIVVMSFGVCGSMLVIMLFGFMFCVMSRCVIWVDNVCICVKVK